MSTSEHYPSARSRFLAGRELRSDEWRETQAVQAGLFVGAYRIAASLVRIETEGYQNKRTDSRYHALLRVVLACAARERLAALLGERVADLPVVDSRLALRIRAYLNGVEHNSLRRGFQDAGVEGPSVEFWDGVDAAADDVAAVALAIRDSVVSGALNSSNEYLSNKKKIAVFLDLADAVLRDSDERFTAWVKAGMGEPVRIFGYDEEFEVVE